MKKIIYSLLIIFVIILLSYFLKDVNILDVYAENWRIKEISYYQESRLLYDTKTKVMYLFYKTGYGAGLTILVDKEGKPLLYKGED